MTDFSVTYHIEHISEIHYNNQSGIKVCRQQVLTLVQIKCISTSTNDIIQLHVHFIP